MTPAIEFRAVSKRFVLHHERPRSFQEMVMNFFRRNGNGTREEFWALKDISFAVEPGEMLGIIGSNGSGKSTTLKLISRLLKPTTGEVVVNGKLSALLELGAGFHPDLTGMENIYLNGSILGFNRAEIDGMKDDIIEFAELERFIDTPLKHYSSGMVVRLGFAIAINVDPAILLIDEVLAVGDEAFQTKCMKHIEDLRQCGKTIVFVSHGLEMVKDLCDRAIWLNHGVVEMSGTPDEAVTAYLEYVRDEQHAHTTIGGDACVLPDGKVRSTGAVTRLLPSQQLLPAPMQTGSARRKRLCRLKQEIPTQLVATGFVTIKYTDQTEVILLPEPPRWGNRKITITAIHFISPRASVRAIPQDNVLVRLVTGEPLTLQIHYRARRPVREDEDVVFGVGICRDDGLLCYGTNTSMEKLKVPTIEGKGILNIGFDNFAFLRGEYTLDVAIHSRDMLKVYDYHRPYCRIAMESNSEEIGVYQPRHTWEFYQEVEGE